MLFISYIKKLFSTSYNEIVCCHGGSINLSLSGRDIGEVVLDEVNEKFGLVSEQVKKITCNDKNY